MDEKEIQKILTDMAHLPLNEQCKIMKGLILKDRSLCMSDSVRKWAFANRQFLLNEWNPNE